jgi:hypothetical protein
MQNGGETMAMSDSSFDLILHELLDQKEFMENLEAENRELRQQIATLRAGRGIFVEILGHRFALLSEPADIPSYTASAVSAVPSTSMPVEEHGESISLITEEPAESHVAMDVEKEEQVISVPETPLPVMDFLLEDDGPISSSSFLQEMQQTDELSFAATSKLAVWGELTTSPTPTPIPASASIPDAKQQQQPAAARDEDEKAALRRELIGSFLLE